MAPELHMSVSRNKRTRNVMRCGSPMGWMPIGLFAGIMSCLFTGCMASGDSPEDELEQGRLLCDRDRHAQAIPHLSRAIDSLPDPTDAWYLRGVAYERTDQLTAARDDYLACLERTPGHLPARNNLGVVFARLEEPEQAIMHLTEVIRAQPDDLLAIRNRALCKHDLGRFSDALADYDRAIELDANDSTTWFQRGNVFVDMGDFARAIADFDRSIELNDQFAAAFMNRGVAKYGQGETRSGDEDVARAQQLQPGMHVPEQPVFETAPPVLEALNHIGDSPAGVTMDTLAAACQFLQSSGFDCGPEPRSDTTPGADPRWKFLSVAASETRIRVLIGVSGMSPSHKLMIPDFSAELRSDACEFNGRQGLLILDTINPSKPPIVWNDDWQPSPADFEPAGFRLRLPVPARSDAQESEQGIREMGSGQELSRMSVRQSKVAAGRKPSGFAVPEA